MRLDIIASKEGTLELALSNFIVILLIFLFAMLDYNLLFFSSYHLLVASTKYKS